VLTGPSWLKNILPDFRYSKSWAPLNNSAQLRASTAE